MNIFQHANQNQHSTSAVRAVLSIQEQCRIISQNEDQDTIPFKVIIGVESGRVYLWSTKPRGKERERWTYTASGAVTIRAARLSQQAHDGQILLGQKVANRVIDHFSMNCLGEIPLNNLRDSGSIYELIQP